MNQLISKDYSGEIFGKVAMILKVAKVSAMAVT